MSRALTTALVIAGFAIAFDVNGFGQDDPFGGDPFGAAPEQRPAQVPIQQRLKQRQQHQHAEVIAKAKAALEKGVRPSSPRVLGMTELEKKIIASFDKKTTIQAAEMPLTGVCGLLSQMHGIPVLVDRRSLEEIGLTSDTPINVSLKGVTLRSALRLILRDLDLTYLVKDEVLQITTLEAAEQNLEIRMYKLPRDKIDDKNAIIQAITTNVVPDTWEALGGPSSIMFFKDVLIVSTTSDVLDQTEGFLGKLIGKLD